MYNGIGILTPRGTGTSGYVQTNKFNLRGPPQRKPEDLKAAHDRTGNRKPDQGILDHNRKREIELKIVQMADALEEQGLASLGCSPCKTCSKTLEVLLHLTRHASLCLLRLLVLFMCCTAIGVLKVS